MKFSEHYLLDEMLVIGKPSDNKYVIAFDKWIWVLDDDTTDKEAIYHDITSKLDMDDYDASDVYEFITHIQEHVQDVLAGQIHGKTLYLYDYASFKLDPKSSVLVKKVVSQLKLSSATYTEDIDSTETKVTKKKMTASIPDIAFHGTSSKYLNDILTTGLRPSRAPSNYSRQGIYHDDLIFFATRIGEAQHHSVHTALQTKRVPVILEFQIPDKDLIIADYDVEKGTGTDIYYTGMGNGLRGNTKSYNKDPMAVSKAVGVYGYKGRIPASFIKYVYVATKPADELYSISDFKKMKPKAALKYLEYMGEY